MLRYGATLFYAGDSHVDIVNMGWRVVGGRRRGGRTGAHNHRHYHCPRSAVPTTIATIIHFPLSTSTRHSAAAAAAGAANDFSAAQIFLKTIFAFVESFKSYSANDFKFFLLTEGLPSAAVAQSSFTRHSSHARARCGGISRDIYTCLR